MLNIGDIITLPEGEDIIDSFRGNGVYRGESTTNIDCISIERLDGVLGGGQNGWWNFKKEFVPKIIVVRRAGEPSTDLELARNSQAPRTLEEWFDVFVGTRFSGVNAQYTALKEKDDKLKLAIETTQKEYQDLLNKRTPTERDKRTIEAKEMMIASLAEQRINMSRALKEYEDKSFSSMTSTQLLEALRSHKKIKEVGFDATSKMLILRTQMIKRPSGISRREMGEFEVRLDSRHPFGRIRIYNKTWKFEDYDHPHINDGRCCFNGFIHPLEQSDKNGNLVMFVDIVISFLETITRGGEYCEYARWFRGRRPIANRT